MEEKMSQCHNNIPTRETKIDWAYTKNVFLYPRDVWITAVDEGDYWWILFLPIAVVLAIVIGIISIPLTLLFSRVDVTKEKRPKGS